jgi:uncharacterized protein YkwD
LKTGVAVFVTAAICAGTATAAQSPSLNREESSLLGVMNHVRTSRGLQPLRLDSRLEGTARSHSASMLRSGTFAHGNFAARIRRAGVRAYRIGENLAWAAGALSRARAIVKAWLGSPGHRANLLHPGFHLVGVGALRGTFHGYGGALMVTTDFAGT